jgi:hypothetical protein
LEPAATVIRRHAVGAKVVATLAAVCVVQVRITRIAPVLADVAGGCSIQTGVAAGTAST